MTWKKSARNKALVLILVVVPALMFGLGASGFLIARAAGLGNNSIWIALVLSTIGFALSIIITLRVGRQYEKIRSGAESPPSTASEKT
jgi:Kef-type K+ transport system membrane component KefB